MVSELETIRNYPRRDYIDIGACLQEASKLLWNNVCIHSQLSWRQVLTASSAINSAVLRAAACMKRSRGLNNDQYHVQVKI